MNKDSLGILQIVRSKSALSEVIQTWKANGDSIGFVPTMGALHPGHLSLISRAQAENDHVVVSIFVNPTQFNEKSDYQKYPREEAADLNLLNQSAVELVFIPSEEEIYGTGDHELLDIDLEGLDQTMEGRFRAGHFRGVVTIVDILFKLVQPDRAYFGQKDFQQLAIIRLLARKYHPTLTIIACAVFREPSGLAMSSRNKLLNEEQLERAATISEALFMAKKQIGKLRWSELKDHAWQMLQKAGEPEYFELVDRESLELLSSRSNRPMVICTAVKVGNVRLIDNVET
jgi:pantoate--beta-alanine ligase